MEKRKFGNTDMSVTVLGYGGAEIGYQQAAQDTVTTLLSAALDAGLNVIDTAECYKDSESLIGNAVSHRRKDYYLFTKTGHHVDAPYPDWDPRLIAHQADRSLQRLKTDHVDLIHLHSCDLSTLQKGDVIAALQKVRDAGKTRYIGYSGDGQAALWAIRSGVFDSLQTSVNVADQESIDLLLPEARRRNMGLIAKRPIANAVWQSPTPPDDYYKPYWLRFRELQYDFQSQPMSQGVAVALRFTLSQPGVHTAIVGTKNPARWKQNAALLDAGPLPQPQIDALRARWKAVAQPDWVGQV